MSNLHKVIVNIFTGEKIVLPKPIKKEIEVFENSVMIAELNKEGYIRYANRRFVELSGYDKHTLIGAHHYIDKHPDMPLGLYRACEEIASEKKIWRGYVKHLRKDGSFYWSLTYMQPRIDSKGEITGYTITRKKAYPEAIMEMSIKYEKMQGKEFIGNDFFLRGELYHGDELATFESRA